MFGIRCAMSILTFVSCGLHRRGASVDLSGFDLVCANSLGGRTVSLNLAYLLSFLILKIKNKILGSKH